MAASQALLRCAAYLFSLLLHASAVYPPAGSLRDLGEVDWEDNTEQTYKQLLVRYRERPADFIVPVIVWSADYNINENIAAEFTDFVTNAFNITGIHPIVVITNISECDVDVTFEKFGDMGVVHRFALENYTVNSHQRNIESDNKILSFLITCIQEAERGIKLRENEDPQFRFITQVADQFKDENNLLKEELKMLQKIRKKEQQRKKRFWFF